MFSKSRFSKLEPSRLRKLMWLFFIAMALPTMFLVYKSYDQLKWEAFYQHRQLAEELAGRIDKKFLEFVEREESRSFSDYSFVVVEGNDTANYLARSPLSQFPSLDETPGVIGYFQIDVDGEFTSPLLPASVELAARYGLEEGDLLKRQTAGALVEDILTTNQLVEPHESQIVANQLSDNADRDESLFSDLGRSREPSKVSDSRLVKQNQNQAAFDKLTELKKPKLTDNANDSEYEAVLERLQELEADSPYKQKLDQRQIEEKQNSKSQAARSVVKQEKLGPRKEKGREIVETPSIASSNEITPLNSAPTELTTVNQELSQKIKIFESEVDPFEVSLLESGHFVLYRKVWRDEQRYIQGLLVEQSTFLDGLIRDTFATSLLSQMSTLSLIYQGNFLSRFDNSLSSYSSRSRRQFDDTLLYRTRLSEPFSQLESIFTVRNLPAGPGSKVVLWTALILGTVLSVGVFLLYKMSLRNLTLVNQQQDFVSAVSHELKTPLTSIRMYGEILQEGWADEEKKKHYYSYIFDESERLTRLINNVLELARMTRNETRLDLKAVSVVELLDLIRSKVDSQIERSEFKLNLEVDDKASSAKLNIDPDVFTQIIINLVDNALKFSSGAEQKVIDISASLQANNKVRFSVRDYGPGIAKNQLKKIFELFYRTEDELTRETTGTGIGLALVSQLTQLMNGKIGVVNREIGAEFQLFFSPIHSS